ncbi:hypothetical protein OAJ09_00925 [Candidatus Pelagibacter sp.]|nr:hypothetical protein [Candidatus Pelagibacter sp.]
MRKLYIIDLNNNHHDISIKNSDIIYINRGNVSFNNSNILKFKKLNNSQNSRKFFLNEFKKKIGFKDNYFIKELEIYNLRNDKNFFLSKILNFLRIKDFLKKNNKYKLYCISDNSSTSQILNQLSGLKVHNIFKGKVNKNIFFKKNFYFYYFKFIFKTLFLISLIKIFNQNNIRRNLKLKKKKWAISLYPNFFRDDKEIFFGDKFNKINFLLSDETHLNHSFLQIIKIYFKNRNKIINIESFINYEDIYMSIKQILKKKKIFNKLKSDKLVINKLNFTEFYQESIINSFINRSKLTIYDKAIQKFQKYYNFKEFHIYLFEYNFGFYLIRKLKKNDCKIIGYQHGIFNKNLMWLDLIKFEKYKIFNPNKIISNYLPSLKEYKNIYKKNIDSYKYSKRKISKLAYLINIRKISDKIKKILIISGTHDIKDIYFYCQNSVLKNKNNIFFIKTHPKNKFYFQNDKNIKKIERINGKSFNKVLVSSTSTISYDLKVLNKKFDIFKPDYKSS